VVGAGGSGDATIEPVESMGETLTCFMIVVFAVAVTVICQHEDEGGGDLFLSATTPIAFESMPVAFIEAEAF
jgi:hypothetical protein